MNQDKRKHRNADLEDCRQGRKNPLARDSQKAKRSYKDTLFRMLFNDKESLLSLYNAVGQTEYRDASQLEIVTLENAIYMNMKNDLAFIINLELNLYEHQSTWNPNMPLRDLFYVAREYEQLIRKETLYSSRLIMLPMPRFIVFCNGRIPEQAEKLVLKLSDSFGKTSNEPDLELKVTVFNINAGYNQKLMNTCRLLKEYSLYVARVRLYAAEMELDQAVERAVEECIREGILSDFLLKSRAEVISMTIFEYDEEREKELIKKAEFESGREKGREEGIEALIEACQDFGASREHTLERLCKRFSLPKEEAEKKLAQFWSMPEA